MVIIQHLRLELNFRGKPHEGSGEERKEICGFTHFVKLIYAEDSWVFSHAAQGERRVRAPFARVLCANSSRLAKQRVSAVLRNQGSSNKNR